MVFPKVTIGQIIGLLEAVNDAGGIEDAARLATDFDLEIHEILPSIEGAELLGFVVVSNGNIELTEDAKKLLNSGIRERKKIIRGKVAGVKIIKELRNKLMESDDYRMSKKTTLKFLQNMLFNTDIESYFKTIINWTRHAGIIGYNIDSEEVCLLSKI